jgi:hypothetical protein
LRALDDPSFVSTLQDRLCSRAQVRVMDVTFHGRRSGAVSRLSEPSHQRSDGTRAKNPLQMQRKPRKYWPFRWFDPALSDC